VNSLKKKSNIDIVVIEKSRDVISKWKEIVATEEQEQERESAQAQGLFIIFKCLLAVS